jgi:hypothetical protein
MKHSHATDSAVIRSLRTRGYLAQAKPTTGELKSLAETSAVQDKDELRKAILALQRAYGLPETGELDEHLRTFLLNPHCSVPDPGGPAAIRAGNVPWPSPVLTYQFMSWPQKLTEAQVRGAFRRACDTWQMECPLRFSEVNMQGDMRIHFGGGLHSSGQHNCQWPFDDQGGTLAHAFYPDWAEPLNGDIHVDTSEIWSVANAPANGVRDLEAVLLHEIGHAVGLVHNSSPNSVMFANYNGPVRKLHWIDVENIKQLYP